MDPYLSVAFPTYAMLIRPPRPPWGPLGDWERPREMGETGETAGHRWALLGTFLLILQLVAGNH